MSEEKSFEEQTFDSIGDILIVLSSVMSDMFHMRLPDDLPSDHPFSALYQGVNGMVDSLAQMRERSEAYQRELEERLQTIDQQRAAIRELSTPVIEVWQGVLCLPIIGVMDTTRSAEITETLLRAIVDKKARYTIIDVSGISVMDTATANHFLLMARAVRLLGAECVLTGINPTIVQTIVHMGVDLASLNTHRSMRDALTRHVAQGIARSKAAAAPLAGPRAAPPAAPPVAPPAAPRPSPR